jgi:hypothetical protein
MHNTFSGILGLIVPLFLAATIATAAPSAKTAEDRYIAARDAAIEKISAIYDAGNADDAARRPKMPRARISRRRCAPFSMSLTAAASGRPS